MQPLCTIILASLFISQQLQFSTGIPTFHHGMIPIREVEEEQGPDLDKYQQYQRNILEQILPYTSYSSNNRNFRDWPIYPQRLGDGPLRGIYPQRGVSLSEGTPRRNYLGVEESPRREVKEKEVLRSRLQNLEVWKFLDFLLRTKYLSLQNKQIHNRELNDGRIISQTFHQAKRGQQTIREPRRSNDGRLRILKGARDSHRDD